MTKMHRLTNEELINLAATLQKLDEANENHDEVKELLDDARAEKFIRMITD